ncbi:MAG TPA: hypothetical protein DDW23_01055 [Planctomycetes bacterium]|nr:hypothetical protein [Planctomycetota bacterium]
MGIEGLLVVALTFAVLLLLISEKATVDGIGIGLLVVLVGAGAALEILRPGFRASESLLSVDDALGLFGNYAVLMIASLYVIGEGLTRTGAVEFIARGVLKFSGGRESLLVLLIGLIAGVISALLNNTAVVVVFIPVLIGVANRTGIPASRLLLPLAFASTLGGMCTLVGTSTNLLVSGVAEALGQAPLGMFEMTPIGVPILVVGVGFMALFSKYLVPARQSLTAMMAGTETREYVTELEIPTKSPLIGKTYSEVFSSVRADILCFIRGEAMIWPPFEETVIESGDVVMLRGNVDIIAGLEEELGLEVFKEIRFDPKTMQFFELAVSPHSSLIGRRVGDLHLWRDYEALVVAVLREGQHILQRSTQLILRPGDLLLVYGEDAAQAKIRARSDFFLLSGAHEWVVLRGKGRLALCVALVAMGLFSLCSLTGNGQYLPLIAMGGAVCTVAGGCLTSRRAYRSIDWPILIFIIGTLALGKAMANSGAADFFANGLVRALVGFGPLVVMGGIGALCVLLSALVSNGAIAILMAPIALQAAASVAGIEGLDAEATALLSRAFLMTVVFSASVCFATPLGHQVNLMVFGPGGYKFSDFLRMGLPLSILALGMILYGLSSAAGM